MLRSPFEYLSLYMILKYESVGILVIKALV